MRGRGIPGGFSLKYSERKGNRSNFFCMQYGLRHEWKRFLSRINSPRKKKESVVGRSLRHASFQFVAWNGSKFRIWFSIFRGANERFKEWIVTKLTKRCSLLHYIFEKSDLTCRNIYKNGNIDKFQNTMVVFLHYLIRYILFI